MRKKEKMTVLLQNCMRQLEYYCNTDTVVMKTYCDFSGAIYRVGLGNNEEEIFSFYSKKELKIKLNLLQSILQGDVVDDVTLEILTRLLSWELNDG